MKLALMTLCMALSLPWNCPALTLGDYDAGAPEVKGTLKCEIRLATNSASTSSHLQVSMTVTNVGKLNAELPSPYSLGYYNNKGACVTMFLLTAQGTNTAQRLVVARAVLPANPTPEQQKIVDEKPAEQWPLFLEAPPFQWLSIPPQGVEEFQIYVQLHPKTEDDQTVNLPPGTYGLQCEIEFFKRTGTSTAYIETNTLIAGEDIAKAKASGIFLLDRNRLWTGKMQSNVAQITLTGN